MRIYSCISFGDKKSVSDMLVQTNFFSSGLIFLNRTSGFRSTGYSSMSEIRHVVSETVSSFQCVVIIQDITEKKRQVKFWFPL